MKLLLNDDPQKVKAVDKLVAEGAFGSRSEVYRTGAWLLLTIKEARRLTVLDRLEPVRLKGRVQRIINAIDCEDIEATRKGLGWVEEALRLRATLSPLLGEEDLRDSFETAADGFVRYSETLAKLHEHDAKTKHRILSDLKRDVAAIGPMVAKSETEASTELQFETPIILIGYRGTGKTQVVGNQLIRMELAGKLKTRFSEYEKYDFATIPSSIGWTDISFHEQK